MTKVPKTTALASLRKYENDVCYMRIPCPFTITFTRPDGTFIANRPIPLTPGGKPKMDLFGPFPDPPGGFENATVGEHIQEVGEVWDA